MSKTFCAACKAVIPFFRYNANIRKNDVILKNTFGNGKLIKYTGAIVRVI